MVAPEPVLVGCWAKASFAAAPALTLIAPDVLLIAAVTESVAVMVRVPAVLSVAANVPKPAVSVLSAGNVAAGSELVK